MKDDNQGELQNEELSPIVLPIRSSPVRWAKLFGGRDEERIYENRYCSRALRGHSGERG